MESLNQIKAATQTGVTELLEAAHLKRGDLFVLGLSTSEVQGEHIGQDSNIEIGRTVVKAIVELLAPRGINLAVQGCEHLNRAHVTYLRSRPKLIGGARAKYEWDPFDQKK